MGESCRLGLRGFRRTHGKPQHGRTALFTADLMQLVVHVPKSLLGTCDRALTLPTPVDRDRSKHSALPKNVQASVKF